MLRLMPTHGPNVPERRFTTMLLECIHLQAPPEVVVWAQEAMNQSASSV